METSPEVNELATAMAKAQSAIKGAVKDSANPFFKSTYADLDSVWDACREPLTSNGLAIVQSPRSDGAVVYVDTMLLHSSGQWIRGSLSVRAKDESPQAVGSCITYLRRYALQSFAGVAPEDDDAEGATERQRESSTTAEPVTDSPIAQQLRASLNQPRRFPPTPPTPPERKAAESGHGDILLISDAQAKRYYAIAKGVGWPDDALHAWLFDNYGYKSSKEIPRKRYEEIVAAVKEGRV